MSRPIALAALLVVAACLGLALAAELGSGPGDGAEAAVRAPARDRGEKAVAVAIPAVAATPTAELVAAIRARPLFAPNRRPLPLAKSSSPTANPNQSDTLPRLSGIIMDQDTRLAIFTPKDAAKPIVLGEGGEIAGRKIAAIAPSEVIVTGPKGEQHLQPGPDPTLVAEGVSIAVPPDLPQPDPRHRRLRPGVAFRPGAGRFLPGRQNAQQMREMRARHGRAPVENGEPGGPDR